MIFVIFAESAPANGNAIDRRHVIAISVQIFHVYADTLVVGRLLRGQRIRSTTREAANFPGWNTYGFWA